MPENYLTEIQLTRVANYRLLRALLLLQTNIQQQKLQESHIDYARFATDLNDDLALPDDAELPLTQALALFQPLLTENQKQALQDWAYAVDDEREDAGVYLTEYQDVLYDKLVPVVLAYILE